MNENINKEAANGTISNPNPVPVPMPAAISSSSLGWAEDRDKKHDQSKFRITALPAAIFGAIIGGAITKKQMEKKMINVTPQLPLPVKNNSASRFERGNYYDQINHLAANMRIIFTPISVVYVVKDGPKELPLETIETEEMNEDMRKAWQNKDYQYYKNLLLNKMYSDILFAEKEFAKRIIENQMDMKKSVDKHAFEDLDFEDITDVELFHYASESEKFFEKESPIIEKIAELFLGTLDDEEYVVAEAILERPFDKYAGAVTDLLNKVPFLHKEDRISSSQGKYLNPSYFNNNLRIGFFPDRVIFIAGGRLVGTLSVLAMNNEGFEHFQKKDTSFFENYFKKEVRKGMARLNEKLPDQNKDQEKTASVSLKVEDIFVLNNVHPAVYALLFTAKYGAGWVNYDSNAFLYILEKDFALTRPIGDIPLNKILSIKSINSSDIIYSSRHAFEKIIRAFNNKPINFLARETQDLDLEDFVFGLDAINRVAVNDNIYDNFSPEIYDYIVKVIADKGNYVWGVSVTGTDEEQQFITIFNYSLLTELNNRFTALIDTQKEKDDIIKENELIFNTTLELISAVNNQLKSVPELNIREFLKDFFDKSVIISDISEIITRQVIKNVVLDKVLDKRERDLISQLDQLKLHGE